MIKICRALDSDNNLITISNAQPHAKYYCEMCKEELIVKAANSTFKAKHFAHKPNSYCVDDWSNHDMSEWHIEWQNHFPECNREVPLSDGAESHRADVLINGFVVEFQHSPITLNDFVKRNNFYTKCGQKVIWVFDGNVLIKDYSEMLKEYNFKRVQNQFENYNNVNGMVDLYIQEGEVLHQVNYVTTNNFRTLKKLTKEEFVNILIYWKELMEHQKHQQLIKEQQIYILYSRPKEYIDTRTAMIRRDINGDINRLPNNFGYSNNNRNRKSYRRNFKRK